MSAEDGNRNGCQDLMGSDSDGRATCYVLQPTFYGPLQPFNAEIEAPSWLDRAKAERAKEIEWGRLELTL
jgi:hypothetical protein